MKTLSITTHDSYITREAASFSIEIDKVRGDLIATGYDKQREKTCVVCVARGEWVDVQLDGDDESAEEAPTESTTCVDCGEQLLAASELYPRLAAYVAGFKGGCGCADCRGERND